MGLFRVHPAKVLAVQDLVLRRQLRGPRQPRLITTRILSSGSHRFQTIVAAVVLPDREDNDEEEFVPDGYLEAPPDEESPELKRDRDGQDSYEPDGYLEYDDKFEDEH